MSPSEFLTNFTIIMKIDFYIRSPQQNPKNKPNREVFLHFFGREITWK